ncbi:msx2-interacting protein [Periophthalmus magnuspinnatus]|nr:msx2-interacting protein [Periophthalmus magnuspinnatus]
MVRETRHLWVGNLPENVREEKIVEHFKRYGRVESVKVLPKRGSEGGVAAFVDFVDIKSAQKAHNAINKMGDRDLRTDYNEPGTIPSAARALDDSLSLGSRGRDVSGFTRGSGGSVYGPTTSLHSRDGRYERRLDGTAESRDRTFDHSTYGHHERPGSSFERQRHYEADYYRSSGSSSGSTGCTGSVGTSGVGGALGSGATGGTGAAVSAGCTTGASAGSTSSVVAFYRSHSRSPCRFETAESRYESRAREAFTLASVVHRDLYREERARRGDRSYRRSRSRSPHSVHSRNPSPQRLGPASRAPCSRSGSGSRSRSSSSDSVSSTSSSTSGSDSSSSSSDESPARSVQSAAVPAHSALLLSSSLDKDEPRKSFGIKVQNLPVRSTDTSLKDGLFHEFKKHGKVTSVQIHGASEERYGLVFFRQQEDQEKALAASKGKLFFGMQIDVTAWNGPETESENEFRPLDERIDEFHPKATRTLFIGNLEKTTTYHDLLNIFQRFGEIVDIDIKKVNGAPQYAFLQYCDIASVCKAIKKMDGEYLGNNRLKLGFGKSMPTTCVWLDGLASNTTEQFLTRHFCRYGHVVKVVFDRMKGMALILYNNIEYAQAAVKDTKGWKIGGSKIKVDFANQESQMAFYRSMQASGQDIRDFYDIVSERRDDRRTQYEYQAERQYYENVRTTRTYTDDPSRKYTTRSREFYTEWDPYQGDYYETQYFEDPREYREYRADPYEQDIRKYSYLQRERERERERFETDRGRDHNRRTIERSQSPSHLTSRRPASPTASPPILERVSGDSDRRVCCRSSERSGSCSSISPPRFDKPEKSRLERYNKSEKVEKERGFETDRGILVEKEKRVHKERGDKEKRLKKTKSGTLGLQACETETDLNRDTSPDTALRNDYNKSSKESSSKGRLDLLPCVVQLTRVKEKEGKLFSHTVEKCKGGSDSSPQLTSPLSEQRSPLFHSESSKGNISKHGKNRDGLSQSADRDLKNKAKKHGKSELGFDIATALDVDRLAARKRRFEDTGPVDKQKKSREDNPSYSRPQKVFTKETEVDPMKLPKKENTKERCVQEVAKSSPQNREDYEGSMDLECQSQLREHCKNSPHRKQAYEGSKGDSLMKVSNDCIDNEQKYQLSENEQDRGKWRDWEVGNSLSDQNNMSDKQTEHIHWLMQKLSESERLDKISSQLLPQMDKEKDCGNSTTIQKKTEDDTSTHIQKKPDHFEFENKSFESTQRPNEDSFLTSPTESSHYSANADEIGQISLAILSKERKSQPSENKVSSAETLKSRFGRSSRYFSNTHPEMSKLCCDEGLMQHWNQSFKPDGERERGALTYTGAEQSGIQKHLCQDLEPGEVESDTDEELDTKQSSPSSNSSLSFILRERDERMTDVKLSASLEKNKFYSFALDKTITPDTKALLERAKTLYSTREDNWSFLPSRFPTSHSCSEKDKQELAPRPIPSWYMKKKKVRTDSVENMSNKTEELKSQDPERQELFASRFLHSSIFEQDSRRLQHLERKDQEMVPGVCKIVKPHRTEVKTKLAVGGSPQEPIVLFHSRFLELQQQKDKDNSSENEFVADVKKDGEMQKDHVTSEKEPESAMIGEDKSSSPQLTLTLCTSVPLIKESTLRPIETQTTDQTLKVENIDLEASPPVTSHEVKQMATKVTITHSPVELELNSDFPTKQKETKKEREKHTLSEETAEERSINVEKRSTEMTYSDLITDNKPETVKNELKLDQIMREKEETKQSPKTEEDIEEVPEPETESKPATSRRQSKNKRSKSVSVSRTSKAASEKPATRKSERIDKEKLKKAMSPRAEGPKPPELKTTTKSPNPPSDSEQKVESSLIHGRTRRRNVRSVYATLREVGEETPPSSRLTRKRAASKDPLQDNPLPVSRRGRPPKRGIKRVEDSSITKLDEKTTVNNTEVTDTDAEALKESEGLQPLSQRLYSAPNLAGEKKGIKPGPLKKSGNKLSMDDTDEENENSETRIVESEVPGKGLEKNENLSAILRKKEKDFSAHKIEQTDIENTVNLSEKQPAKSGKTKTAWVKRNMKLEERSHNLKNLEIRVSVDDVKGLLRSEDNEQDSFQNSILKTKMVIQEKAEPEMSSDDGQNLGLEIKDETLSESELNTDPTAALLARQKELEQAVENIAKLAAEQPARSYKESANTTSAVLPPVNVESEEAEEEKRANPASETELAAAIDSITAEVSCTEGDGFTTTSTYPAIVPTSGSTVSSSASEITEPETHIAVSSVVASHSDNRCLTPNQGPSLHDTLKKTGKVQTKSPKKPRGRKTTKREDIAAKASELQPSPSKLPESIPETPNSIGMTVTTGTSAATTVVTAVVTCRRDVTSSITVDTPKEAEKPEVEQPVPKESACHSGTFHVSTFKNHPLVTEHPTISLDADLPPAPQHNLSQRVPKISHWAPKSEESRIYVPPPCHVTVVTPSIPSTALGNTSANPPLPPDTKASDIDASSSTLRKILMEPKYVSASSTSTVSTTTTTTLVTSTLSDPLRMSEKPAPLYSEERATPFQPIHHKPSPLTESQQNYRDKSQNTIIPSPTTSVISRIPLPYDTEETPRISLSSRNISQTTPRPKHRLNSNENTRYHSIGTVDDGKRGRLLSDANPFNSASVPGLRVNTSEGVVVLSYSGQKTEGPQRMRAKISQIPQASVVDVEFQQPASKSQIKQEASQLSSPKAVPSPLTYGHSGGQTYNTQNVITTTKQNSPNKSDAPHHMSSQGGVVKIFQQPGSSPQVLYNQPVIQQHGKRVLGHEPPPKKIDSGKVIQTHNLSPVMCPPQAPLSGPSISPSPGLPTDRSVLQGNQETLSPRTSVQSPPPYHKTCSLSNSPIGASVVLGHSVSSYSTIHHTHSEQSSVIIQPHSVSHALAHSSRADQRSVSGINYGKRSDSHSSSNPGPPQRSNASQSNVIHNMVLQSHLSPKGSILSTGVSGANDDISRHLNQAANRHSASQPDVTIIHSEHRALHTGSRMDQYRDIHQRMLMHQQLGEQASAEVRQLCSTDSGSLSSNHISQPLKSSIVSKGIDLTTKGTDKQPEGKLIQSPSSDSRIRGVQVSSPVFSHPHGVKVIQPGTPGSFPVYQDMQAFPTQFTGHLSYHKMATTQVPIQTGLGHRSKLSHPHGGGSNPKPDTSHLLHATSTDYSHISRMPGDTISPSYQSPMSSPIMSPVGLNHKPEASVVKQSPTLLRTPSPAVPPSPIRPHQEAKQEHTGHRSFDMMQLLTKYPIVWQGLLALKNDQAAVQLHFVSGNTLLAQRSLPPPEGAPLLRIVQRMRLEASQLDSVARRMTVENDYCLLLALPCGRDQEDVLSQTHALKTGFITYLQAKQAAGIINVANPGSNQPAFVVQIFPPCEFSESHLSLLAPDLLNSISSISPHLMIVIASV